MARRRRRKLGGLVITKLFHAASYLGRLHPRSRPARHGVEVLRNIAYTNDLVEHRLDVYRPTSEPHRARHYDGPPWPVVLYVHGGGFAILSKETHWLMALAFARRGFVVFNIDYRLAPRNPFPAAVEDVCLAYRWVVENAARYGGDPSRIVLAGESAGANLVTSLAIALAYERPEAFARAVHDIPVMPVAVAAACGVFQVSDLDRLPRDNPRISRFTIDRMQQIERAYLRKRAPDVSLDLADPLVTLERAAAPRRPLPPFFLPVGTNDPLLPDTRRLATALRALGATVDDRYYPGEPHAFHALVMRSAARECWRDTFAFLRRFVPSTTMITAPESSR